MKLLLDTCTFLWIASDPDQLSQTAAKLFQDENNACYLSSVSAWEIAVVVSLGRVRFSTSIDVMIPRVRRRHGIRTLRLLESATMTGSRLPFIHRDPFDRMLICQAIAHGMTLLTPDEQIAKYAVPVIW